jgi:hypothetical protein
MVLCGLRSLQLRRFDNNVIIHNSLQRNISIYILVQAIRTA